MHFPSFLSRIRVIILSGLKISKLKQIGPVQKKIIGQLLQRMRNVSWKSPRVIGSLSVTAVLVGGLSYYLLTTTSAAAVIVNDQQIGFVSNTAAGQELVETYLEQQGQPFGQVAKTHDLITYKTLRIKSQDYLASSLSSEELAAKLSYYLEGYKIEAEGSFVAILPSQEDAQKVLNEYQNYYVKPSAENKVTSVSFAENVDIEEVEIQPDQMDSLDDAVKTMIDGKITTKEYTVQPNDSWWLIARKNDMLTDEVVAGNPGKTKESALQPGQVLNLVSSTPYLTVVSEGIYSGAETIPFDVETKSDSSLGSGQTKVLKEGSNGSKIVTYSYVQKNGVDVAKEVLDEKITQAPVNQVVAKGPNRPTYSVAYTTSRGSNNSSSLVDRALSLQGSRYVFGGSGQGGFDCSGFTKYVFAGSGISLPRTSYDQFASGSAVSKDNLLPGDLVFFSTYSAGASHVGIYIGGGRFVHASTASTGVITSSMSDSFYSSRYLGARRY